MQTPNYTNLMPFTIALAEDDLDDQELLQEAFKEIDPDINLVCATSGKGFLLQLDKLSSPPNLIILDYNMPEMNGVELLEVLLQKEEYSEVIKIVWSTSNSPLFKKQCLQFGAHDYLVKPNNITELATLARKMLAYIN